MPRRAPPPLWFQVLVAAALALALRAAEAWLHGHPIGAADMPGVQLAFWGIVIGIAQAIWTGAQVAAKITLAALAWSVKALWFFAVKVWDGAKAIGGAVAKLAGKTWDLLRHTYDRVLKPAWSKFWKFVESAKKWLQKYVGPVLEFLNTVRSRLLEFYAKWIRPILDTIGLVRRVLQLLARLGVEWAKTLDAKLGTLEARIDGVFRRVLAELNQVINLVNRVVTADGLFQRLAFIRTLLRDVEYAWQALLKPVAAPLTEAERAAHQRKLTLKTPAEHVSELRTYVATRGGPIAPRVEEWIADVRLRLPRS